MSTVRVHLAEVPTDVLVYLSAHPSRLLTVPVLADMLAPLGTVGPEASVGAALRLLREAGYVYKNGDHAWGITTTGLLAVQRARCVICQSGRVSEGDLYGEIEAHRRHVSGGSEPNPPEATSSNAPSSSLADSGE